MTIQSFNALGIPEIFNNTLTSLGYEEPTPIQAATIPILMKGCDLMAQAQTGTGKTAAFALPILAQINPALRKTQALIITPTRELTIQVAEAFESYAKNIGGIVVAPIYGGQEYKIQLNILQRGPQVVVATPGRVMDHLRRGKLPLDGLKTVILDEADEMLRQGFLEDVTWILEQIPHAHQTALFSATMPASIVKVAEKYLKSPERVHIKPVASTASLIEQSFTRVASQANKVDVLVRFLEVETVQAAIVFSRTKQGTVELSEQLRTQGFSVDALNGDMNQAQRKQVIERLKKGTLDIVVATDVAARGIDVERVSHVINYDIPFDAESYIHRIGRTGRAGRRGKAFLFITPREYHLFKSIERTIKQTIQQIDAPSNQERTAVRARRLAEKIGRRLEKQDNLKPYQAFITQMMQDLNCDAETLAATLVSLIPGSLFPLTPLKTIQPVPEFVDRPQKTYGERRNRTERSDKPRKSFADKKRPAKPWDRPAASGTFPPKRNKTASFK